MTFITGELIKCQQCGTEFRKNPFSTIQHKFCYRCQKLKDFERNSNNKKLLARSSFVKRKEGSAFKTNKYATRKTEVVKEAKKRKSPRQRFYSSAAWRWFSRYVLTYYSENGITGKCVTCGAIKRLNDKELHLGHWIKVFDANSSNYSTAFEFTNLGTQCSQCNRFMGGRERLMGNYLKSIHGEDELNRLQELSNRPFKLDDYTIDEIAKEYRNKLHNLLKERKWDNPWKK